MITIIGPTLNKIQSKMSKLIISLSNAFVFYKRYHYSESGLRNARNKVMPHCCIRSYR